MYDTFMTRIVRQEDGFGCGFACLANLFAVSYQEVLLLVYKGHHKAKNRGLYCRDIVNILRANGYHYAHFQYLKPNVKRLIYKNGAIVYIKKSKRYPAGHYLLRANDKWIDPWINFVDGRDVTYAKAGYRKRLPGVAIYGVFIK